MPLNATQIELVRRSYAMIVAAPEDYSALFYHRLHQQHPFTRALFPDDMTRQVRVFRQTIDALVDQVDDLARISGALVAMADRHVGYGVLPSHYAAVGEVLIDSFAELIGDRFTPAMRVAWETLYRESAAIMTRAGGPGDAA